VSGPGARPAPRALAVGGDAESCAALHGAAAAAGHALWCVPAAAELEAALRLAAPQLLVLLLPETPDASWGAGLAAASGAARAGVRVIVVAPSREAVEPLAFVAGAERAVARAELLARPAAVFDPPPAPARAAPAPGRPSPAPPAAAQPEPGAAPARPAPRAEPAAPRPAPDLAALIDEELEGEPRNRPRLTRIEVNVSLVSEHNFYVGTTRRVDSGGVFVSTAMPPPVGTRLQIRLGLADGRKLDLDGEVAFIREKGALGGRHAAGCGVKLIGLPGWAVDVIERFTQARPPIVWTSR
jgi:hypothetical protein